MAGWAFGPYGAVEDIAGQKTLSTHPVSWEPHGGNHLKREMLPGELPRALMNANITSKPQISKQLPLGLDTE